MKGLNLKHILHCINGKWYWICPVCGEWLAPHEAGKYKGHFVLQSKGIAIKHLVLHNVGYKPKGETVQEIVSKRQYFCNKCGNHVVSRRKTGYLGLQSKLDWKPGHRFFCSLCADDDNYSKGLKTKCEVHKG